MGPLETLHHTHFTITVAVTLCFKKIGLILIFAFFQEHLAVATFSLAAVLSLVGDQGTIHTIDCLRGCYPFDYCLVMSIVSC